MATIPKHMTSRGRLGYQLEKHVNQSLKDREFEPIESVPPNY